MLISFFKPVRPSEGYKRLLQTRAFFSSICGAVVDLIGCNFVYKKKERFYNANFYFYDPQMRPKEKNPRFLAIISLDSENGLFSRVIDEWLNERDQQATARYVFIEVLKQDGIVHLGQIKELCTCIEMIYPKRTSAIAKSTFGTVATKMKEILATEAMLNPSQASGLAELKARIDNLNYPNARSRIATSIEKLGDKLVNENFADRHEFVSECLRLRNLSTHDPSKITAIDYSNLSWYVSKLKMIVAINLMKALGASDQNILSVSPILSQAALFGKTPPN